MRKVLVTLAAFLSAALPLGVPVYAQTPPHVFVGEVTLDGITAPDGTPVKGLVDGVPVSKAETLVQDGKYTLFVEQPSKQTINFAVGDFVAEQSAQWETGGASVLDLTATSHLPSIRLTTNPSPPEQATAGDQFVVKVIANTGFYKATGGQISLNYNPEVFQVGRDRSSLYQGPSYQVEAGPGAYQSNWDYLAPTSTASYTGELEGIFFTILETAPAGPTNFSIRASLISETGQRYELEPEEITYQVKVAGLSGDFNQDKKVDILDLANLGKVWGLKTGEAGFDRRYDIDNDGLIGVGDLVSLLQSYSARD